MGGTPGTITATVSNVTGGASVSSISWITSVPTVASATTPGNSTTVNPLSVGSTAIRATANLSPNGICSTNGTAGNGGPATVTVAQPTCTVSLSTATPTISVGQTALVTANVTNVPAGTTIGSINWTSSAPTIGTIPSPTVTGIISNNVTGVSAGTTNISATVNLSPSGSCSTATSLGITVLPRSWWQVSGGDVYANNINSQIPLSCTTGCYINLAN